MLPERYPREISHGSTKHTKITEDDGPTLRGQLCTKDKIPHNVIHNDGKDDTYPKRNLSDVVFVLRDMPCL